VLVYPPARAACPTCDLTRVDQPLRRLGSDVGEPFSELLAGQSEPIGEPLDQQRGEPVGQQWDQPLGKSLGVFVEQPLVDQADLGSLSGA
jgi:hypothetical protein